MGRDAYEHLLAGSSGLAECPITRDRIPYVEKNHQLVEILKLVDESAVYESRDANKSNDDYIKELESIVLRSYVSNPKRSNDASRVC